MYKQLNKLLPFAGTFHFRQILLYIVTSPDNLKIYICCDVELNGAKLQYFFRVQNFGTLCHPG